jgi:hypothetical protein
MQEKHGIAPQLAAKSSSRQSIEPLIGFVEKSDEWDGDMHKKTSFCLLLSYQVLDLQRAKKPFTREAISYEV